MSAVWIRILYNQVESTSLLLCMWQGEHYTLIHSLAIVILGQIHFRTCPCTIKIDGGWGFEL